MLVQTPASIQSQALSTFMVEKLLIHPTPLGNLSGITCCALWWLQITKVLYVLYGTCHHAIPLPWGGSSSQDQCLGSNVCAQILYPTSWLPKKVDISSVYRTVCKAVLVSLKTKTTCGDSVRLTSRLRSAARRGRRQSQGRALSLRRFQNATRSRARKPDIGRAKKPGVDGLKRSIKVEDGT